ncbi:FtsX-like permease family protein [Actinoplanes sp. NPDC049548]|uniref:FtsX-like permease family protein n=1 Tax=Actinoplanes sp. NPDC049548 TaxID=3155152 RepID=UPI003419B435
MMLRLALRTARHRIAALIAVACATLGGAAFVTGIGVLAESGLRSHAPAGRLGAADVVVAAPQRLDAGGDLAVDLPERARIPAAVVARIAEVPGVTAAVGDLSFPAALVTTTGQVVPGQDPRTAGHGWSSATLLDPARITGAAPTGPRDVALDSELAASAGVRPGDRVTVVAAGQRATYRVTAVLSGAYGGIYVADATAARLTGRGGAVDLVAVRSDGHATERIRDLVRPQHLAVTTGAARGDVAAPEVRAARALLPVLAGSMAGVTLLVVGFMVAGALAVSLAAQRRDLALLRAVGATPRQVRRLAVAQAVAVTAVTLPPGIALGYLLAEQLRQLLVRVGMLPGVLPLTISPLPGLAAVLLLLGAVAAAAWCVAWRISRMPATEAVAESRVEPRHPSRTRAFAGLLLLAAATVLAAGPLLARTEIGAASTAIAGILATIGVALAGPLAVQRSTAWLRRRLPGDLRAPAWLAVSNTHGYALRTAGAVTTLAMAVVFTLTYGLTQTTVLRSTADDLRAGTVADVEVSAPGLGGIPVDAAPAVAAVPGVRAAVPVTSTTVVWPYRIMGEPQTEAAPALAVPASAAQVLDPDVRSGRLADLRGATVAVDAEAARARKVKVGSAVELFLGDGIRVTARVVAVYSRGLGFGPLLLSQDLAAGHTTTGLADRLLVRTDGTPAARDRLAAVVPGLDVRDPRATVPVPAQLWINVAVLAVLLGYLLLGIANKLVAATAQRRTELAALRWIGATPAQLRAMMRVEAGLVGVAALVTGVVLAAVPLALLGVGFLHRPWPAGPLWLAPAVLTVVAALAFLTVEIPTRRALRVAPAQALVRE